MADFYRTNGNTGPAGTFISFIGKTPKCFGGYIANGSNTAQDLRAELGVNLAVPGILNALESNATVLAYQIENVNSGNISVLLEGASHLTASDIQGIIRGNSPYGNNAVVATGSIITDVGFKLANS
jgi:hypothetical protein